MLFRICLIVFALVSTHCFADNNIHSYTDENGKTVYYSTGENKTSNSPTKDQYQNNLKRHEQNNNSIANRRDSVKPVINISKQPLVSPSSIDAIVSALMGQLILTMILGVTLLIFWLIALVDILRNEFTGSNKIIWLLLLILLPPIGTILYFIIGKGQKITAQQGSSEDQESTIRSYRKPEI